MQISKLVLAGVLLVTGLSTAQAAQSKKARSNDLASEYILDDRGNFFRKVRGNKCQITNRVESFKVSQHPNDAAVAYFKKDGDLYVLHNASRSGQCPKTSKKVIVEDIKKYSVISSTNTTVVNLTLDRNGKFLGWDNKRAVVRAYNVDTYKHNECFGVKKKSFKSYVAFAIDRHGSVLKVKGHNPGSSKWSHKTYDSIKDFKRKERVCK